MAIPLEWKASIYGAEDVKNKLTEIRTEYQNGGIGIQEYTQKSTYLTRQLRQSNQSLQMQKSVFLATHPALNKLSQAMSVYGSVSRTVLGVMNAINLASIASHQNDQQLFDAKMALMEEQNKLNRMLEAGLTGAGLDEQIAKVKELKAQLKGVQDEAKRQDTQQFVTNITAIGTVAGETVTSVILLLPQLKKLKIALEGMSLASLTASGPYGIMAAAFIALGIAAYYAGNALGFNADGFGKAFMDLDTWWYTTGQPTLDSMTDFFMKDIPAGIGVATAFITDFFTNLDKLVPNIVNSLIDGLQSLINGLIAVVNVFIAAYNKFAKLARLPKADLLKEITLPKMGSGGATTGGSSQAVPFAGSAFAGSAGGAVTNIIIQGSILAEREVAKIADDALKDKMKRVGFG